MEGKVWVRSAQARDEVILEGPDGPFRSISPVDTGGGKLEIHILVVHELFEDGGGFVVESLEFGAKTCSGEDSMGTFVGGEDLSG